MAGKLLFELHVYYMSLIIEIKGIWRLYISVAVEGLAGEAGKDGVGLDEAGEFGVVVAGVVVVEAGVFVDDLAGIAVGDGEGGGFFLVVFFAEGAIAVVLDDIAVAVDPF